MYYHMYHVTEVLTDGWTPRWIFDLLVTVILYELCLYFSVTQSADRQCVSVTLSADRQFPASDVTTVSVTLSVDRQCVSVTLSADRQFPTGDVWQQRPCQRVDDWLCQDSASSWPCPYTSWCVATRQSRGRLSHWPWQSSHCKSVSSSSSFKSSS